MPDQIPLVQPQPLQNPVQTMSGILGLQQQTQALQTGQYLQQSAEAGAQNDTRTAQEKQRIAAYVSNPANKGKKAADMADDIRSLAPTVGPEYLTQQTGLEQKETELKGAQSKLSAGNQELVGNLIGSLVGGKETPEEVQAKLAWAGKANPQLAPLLSHYSDLAQHLPPPGPERDQMLNQASVSLGAKSPLQAGTVDTGGNILPVATNTNTGGTAPTGQASIEKTLAPTQKLPYVASAAAATTAAGKGAANDEELYNNTVAAGTKSAQVKGLTQDIAKLADEVKTGTYTKAMADKWTTISQAFGISPSDTSQTTRRQLLAKYTRQLALQQEASNGASTDAAQSHVDAAMPDPDHMDPEAIKSAARFVGGQADLAAERAKVANAQRQANGGSSTGLRAVDSSFMANADPRAYVYRSLALGAERQAYLKEHFKTPGEIQDFLDKQAVTKHLAGGM